MSWFFPEMSSLCNQVVPLCLDASALCDAFELYLIVAYVHTLFPSLLSTVHCADLPRFPHSPSDGHFRGFLALGDYRYSCNE